ncbi:hypothetical protein CRN67_02755 [Campylobacter blaseri]|uniref:Uncharacterized protein n=1 Tax=Campylobacter blaseri TaxID=2042961 RepID=A0A2P8R2F9_9BACT|nr:hypothetical protein CQ405_02755 [Campylobacter blaseri]PSM54317.1 hypothetical protein CRN67_02755 [Campylobacter blaseri]
MSKQEWLNLILAPLLPLFIIVLYAKCAKSIIKNEKLDNDLYLLYILVVIGYILIDKFSIL